MEDRPRKIKGEVFPYDNVDVDAALQSLHDAGLILRYEVGGARYIEVINFIKHQRPHYNEVESTLPPPREQALATLVASGNNQGSKSAQPRHTALRPDTLIPDTLIPDTGTLIPEINDDEDDARARDPFDPTPQTPEDAATQRILTEFIPCGVGGVNAYTADDIMDMLARPIYGANIEAREALIIRALKAVGQAVNSKRSWGNVKGLIAYWLKNGESKPKSTDPPDYTPPTGNPFARKAQ